MKCRDESKLLNYQEPYNYLCGNIKFYKPGQITSFLPPSVYGAQKGNRKAHHLKKFHYCTCDLFWFTFCLGKNKDGGAVNFPKCCMCVQEGLGFLFSVVLPFCLLLTTKIKFLYCGCPWIYFCWQIHCPLLRRNWSLMQDVQWKFSGLFEGLKNLSFLEWGSSGRPWNLGPHSCAS